MTDFAYQVQRSTDGSTWSDVAGASGTFTAASPFSHDVPYTIQSADAYDYLRLKVTRLSDSVVKYSGLVGPVESAVTPPVPSGGGGGTFTTADKYASPTGSDTTGTGTLANPYKTMAKLFRSLSPGQIGMLRGGMYSSIDTSPYHMYLSGSSNGSSAANPVTVTNYPSETAQILGPVRVANGWDGVRIVGNGGASRFKMNGWPQAGTSFDIPAVWAYGNDFLLQDVDIMCNDPADPYGNHSRGSATFFGNPSGPVRALRPTIRRCRLHDVHWTGVGNQPHGCYCDVTDGALFENLLIYNIIGAGVNQYALQIYPNSIHTVIRQVMIYNCNGGVVIGTQSSGQASNADVSNIVAHSVVDQPVVKTIIASGSTVSATLADCHTYNCPHGLTASGSRTNLTDNGGHTTGNPLEANLSATPPQFSPFGNPDAAAKGPDWS